MKEDPKRSAAVPTGRSSRLFHMGGVVAAIAGGVVAGGLRQLASGQRPDLPNLLLTPSNALRLTSGLSHLRGAALKLGQMLSMDTGLVLSPQISQIFASLRDDAKPMPPKQLQTVLNAQWGQGWLKQFRRFDVRPFAAASIWLAHQVALDAFGTQRRAGRATIALTALMVAYTVVSLAVIAEPMVVFTPPDAVISR